MDFAENYTVTFQDEIQSAHWKQRQISTYTVLIWYRESLLSKVILSDCRDHDKKSVAAFTAALIEMISKTLPTATSQNLDGWSQQPI